MKRLTVVLTFVLIASAIVAPVFAQAPKQEKPGEQATVTGTWKMTARQGNTSHQVTLELKQEGAAVSGRIVAGEGRTKNISKASFSDGLLKFTVVAPEGVFDLEGKLEGDQLTGSYTAPSGNKETWEARRLPEGGAVAASAGIAGSWKVMAKDGERTREYTMELKQAGDALSGTMLTPDGEVVILSKLSFADNTLKFIVLTDEGVYQVEGKLESNKLTGTYLTPNGRKDTWEASRVGPGAQAAASAGIAGDWRVVAYDGDRNVEFTLQLKQEGDVLSGRVLLRDGQSLNLSKVTFSGSILKFTVPASEGNFELESKLEGDKLTGSFTTPSGRKGTWEASRI